jgi:hypothetical protein
MLTSADAGAALAIMVARMARTMFRKGWLLLCLFAVCCGETPGPAPAAPRPPQLLKCPVCASEFPRDRTVVVQDPCGEVFVCSEGCSIRWSVRKTPPTEGADSRAESLPESQSGEER